MNNFIKFSIVVCAYNAEGRLRDTLEHLAALDYPSASVEVVLVDNNSTDNTLELVHKVWGQSETSIRLNIVTEYAQGLSYARKRGVAEATGQYIVFCDDDNWLDSQYLIIANDVLRNNNSIGVLGGQGVPVTDADCFPVWFYTYAGGFATGVQAMQSGDISSRGYVWGAGAVVCRDFLVKFFASNHDFLLSGRSGQVLAAGDDSEMCKWFLLGGYKLWYDDRLVFHHFIPSARLTESYLVKQREGFESARRILSLYNSYLYLKMMRKRWRGNPFLWLRTEWLMFLNKNEDFAKVVEIARTIEKFNSN